LKMLVQVFVCIYIYIYIYEWLGPRLANNHDS